MADPTTFEIDAGIFALALVDTAAVGYLSTWQAPAGVVLPTVAEADYNASSVTWKCQVTSGALTPSANSNDITVDATWCSPAKKIPQPGETSYTLDVTFLQDPQVTAGLLAFLYAGDTKEAYFMLGLAGSNPPMAIGRVRLLAGGFGGAARSTLTSTISLPLSRRADIQFGTIDSGSVIVKADGTVTTVA